MNNPSSLHESVDKGIANVVTVLRKEGVEAVGPCTTNEAGVDVPEPSIRFQGSMVTLLKATSIAQELGLAVLTVRLSYSAGKGLMLGPWWEMIFAVG